MPRKEFAPGPTTLKGEHAVLAPLSVDHAADLFAAGRDDATWIYMPRPALRSVADAESMIRQALVETEAEREVAFAIVSLASARVARRASSTSGKATSAIGWLDVARAACRHADQHRMQALAFSARLMAGAQVTLKTMPQPQPRGPSNDSARCERVSCADIGCAGTASCAIRSITGSWITNGRRSKSGWKGCWPHARAAGDHPRDSRTSSP